MTTQGASNTDLSHGFEPTRPRLIVGMGATGLSVARHLLRAGIPFAATDSRAAPPKADALAALADVACRFGGFASPLGFGQIAEAVVSPGVSLDEPFIQALRGAGVAIVGDIELFARAVAASAPVHRQAPVIAITGSNGKSTVAAWLAEVARAASLKPAVGGNFGTPALDLLDRQADLYILELSSFQLEATHGLAATAATVVNISADHLDRHGDMARYAKLKARVFARAETAVLNADDPRVASMDTGGARVVYFGTRVDADYRLDQDPAALCRGRRAWLACDALALAGRHNQLNALAVWALAEAIGVEQNAIRDGLRGFSGLPHRCQTVAEIAGVRWVNDSKGTNLGALLACLDGMRPPVVLLAGGRAKGADFTALGPVAAAKAKAVIVYGEDGPAIAGAVRAVVAVYTVATLAAAVARAAAIAAPGDTVLLSPGCASQDQFDDYVQRGEAFAAAVRGLAA